MPQLLRAAARPGPVRDGGLTQRISWNLVGLLGSLFALAAAVAAFLPAPRAGIRPGEPARFWIWVGVWVGVTALVAFLLSDGNRPRFAVWPVVLLGELSTLLLVDAVFVSAISGLLGLVCLFSGLTRGRYTAWWVAVPATAIFLVMFVATSHPPTSVVIVRTVITAAVFVAVAQIPAVLLDRVRSQQRQLDLAAATDPLTGLSNRRDLGRLLDRWSGNGAVVLLDIDHFKDFNDTRGHAAGDHLLTIFAAFLHSACRTQDQLVRFGGEEFLAVLPDTGLEGAAVTVGRWLTSWNASDPDLPTFSAGVALLRNAGSVRDADAALYEAKRAGRNRVHVWTEPVPAVSPH